MSMEIWEDVSLRLILKDKFGNLNCLFTTLLIMTLWLRYSLKKRQQQSEWALLLKQGVEATAAHLYWRLKKISCRACPLFSCFFLVTKLTIAFKSSFGLCLHPLIIEFFQLPSNSSESRKKYTLSLPLICLQEVEF